ncbi:SDR family oxidoreductase [Pedobacter agri]|uniref:SDR family oxidoreductase n=1 Tax=Pedobacter agri TaxID=454586 RepID=UPI00292F9DDA|nr:SDR family oxidoreductase [Pedobacter agri]
MKTIMITGASSGLGKVTAQLFHSKGWRVIATMRHPKKENQLTKLKNVILLPLDISNTQQITETTKQITDQYSIDVVLNNAGYGLVAPLEAMADDQIVKQLNTNLLGVIRVTQAFIAHFRMKKSGMFINITSTFGLMGFPTCSIYSATKFAVDGFSESLAIELAQFGIQVKVIAPGGIQTDFASRSMESAQHDAYEKLVIAVSKGYSAEQVANYSKVEDIAQVVFKAANDGTGRFRYIAGQDALELIAQRTSKGAEAQVQELKSAFAF